jgi:large subunit ribosomal protein L13e
MTEIQAKVLKRAGKQRFGRGFSRNEIKKAGTDRKEALKLGIPLDSKRRTVHEENVETIKTFLKNRRTAVKPKKKPKNEPVQ